MRRRLTCALALTWLGALPPPRAVAQGRDSTPVFRVPAPNAACIAAIPASEMKDATVYLVADAWDSTAIPLRPQADLMAQSAAERVRRALGAADALPRGEPQVTWREVDATVDVIARRGAGMRVLGSDGGRPTAGRALLAQALEAVAAEGPVLWPDGVAADSVRLRFQLVPAVLDADGRVTGPTFRQGFPVFTVAEPTRQPVRVVRAPRVSYPVLNIDALVEGYVIMRFVVDTTGRADPASIQDFWPPTQPPLAGEMAAYYKRFVEAVRRGLLEAQFEPARIGGCRVHALTRMPFSFGIRR